MKRICIANRIQTPDGTILHSKHRHDFVWHVDRNGQRYCLDGGNDYCKMSYNDEPPINSSIFSTDDFEIVRQYLLRGTYGKNGDTSLNFVPLCEMSNQWVLNTIKYIEKIEPNNIDYISITNKEVYLELYHKELDYRYDRNILIEDYDATIQSNNNSKK